MVCCDCSRVLDMSLNYDEIYLKKDSRTSSRSNNQLYNYIYDICSNIHIYDSIIEKVYDEFQKIVTQCRQFSQREITAFCLYSILKKEGVGRSKRDIASSLNVSEKSLWKIDCLPQYNLTPLDPKCLLESKYKDLKCYNFKEMTKMKELLDLLPYSDESPLTKAAGVMYCYGKAFGKKITLCQLSRMFKISVMSIRRYHNKFFVTLCKELKL